MTAERKTGETPFEQAGKARQELRQRVEVAEQAEMIVPHWLAAILSGFPHQVLEDTGILIVPEKGESRIVAVEIGITF